MQYVEVEEALTLPGLRLVLTVGVPGPWCEAAKSVFFVKGVAYTAVRQNAGEESEELLRWTRQTGAPAAMFEDERPRTGWAEILFLAERLAPDPPLLPASAAERTAMLGLCHEICGEQGFGWSRRLMILDPMMRDQADVSADPFAWKYGYSPEAADQARQRVIDLLAEFAGRLRAQQARGSRYLFGGGLTAADIYWAAFSAMLVPLSQDVCPMDDGMRGLYDLRQHPASVPFDEILLEHRDFIYETHLALPLDF